MERTQKEHGARVLVCPLDWGLGHASRCIPVIRVLQRKGFTVLTAGYGDSHILLRQAFPELIHLSLPGFSVKYSRKKSLVLAVIWQSPSFFFHILKEHLLTSRIVEEQKVDIILSDNRYGVHHKSTHNILITHQLQPISPVDIGFLQYVSRWITGWFCRKFNEVWIPDLPGKEKISGILSDSFGRIMHLRHVGILSRFSGNALAVPDHLPDILVLISGPEPQRTMLEQLLTGRLSNCGARILVIQGKPGIEHTGSAQSNIRFEPHLSDAKLEPYLQHVPLIIARAGYSTIMDLLRLGRNALLIPTPGQTEQEYLAQRLKGLGYFESLQQDEINQIEIQLLQPEVANRGNRIRLKYKERVLFTEVAENKPDFQHDTLLEEAVSFLWKQHHHHKIDQESRKISKVDL